MTATLDTLINRIERELESLVNSGNNWQITLHGGRCGHVKIETLIIGRRLVMTGRRFRFFQR